MWLVNNDSAYPIPIKERLGHGCRSSEIDSEIIAQPRVCSAKKPPNGEFTAPDTTNGINNFQYNRCWGSSVDKMPIGSIHVGAMATV
jgi:hypothetical protein